jgi:anaerobic magnesium-protoporphyrin IX monomethyl ester cyclase
MANLDVIHRMGIRQLHIADWTFAVNRRQTTAIVEEMIARRYGFSWSCLSRVDLVDGDLLALFKRAGCELIEFGVESGNQAILDRYDKHITVDQVRRAFAAARDLDLPTLATFVFGLPGETPDTLQETLDLALEIRPSFCSFNVASPRMATQLRRDMLGAGLIADDPTALLDSSWSAPVFSTPELDAGTLHAFRRRAIREFYFRPSYLLSQLGQTMGSVTAFRNAVENGMAMAWRLVR